MFRVYFQGKGFRVLTQIKQGKPQTLPKPPCSLFCPCFIAAVSVIWDGKLAVDAA